MGRRGFVASATLSLSLSCRTHHHRRDGRAGARRCRQAHSAERGEAAYREERKESRHCFFSSSHFFHFLSQGSGCPTHAHTQHGPPPRRPHRARGRHPRRAAPRPGRPRTRRGGGAAGRPGQRGAARRAGECVRVVCVCALCCARGETLRAVAVLPATPAVRSPIPPFLTHPPPTPPLPQWLEHAGAPLHPLHTLAAAGVSPSSTLAAHPRVRGGGGDGGSTGAENRAAYLEMYAEPKAAAVDPGVTALARCTRCALSGGALSEPIVCDELGSLFNKVRVGRECV